METVNRVLASDMREMWKTGQHPTDFIIGYAVETVGIQKKFVEAEVAKIRDELGENAADPKPEDKK